MSCQPNVRCTACLKMKPRNRCVEVATPTGVRLGWVCARCARRLREARE